MKKFMPIGVLSLILVLVFSINILATNSHTDVVDAVYLSNISEEEQINKLNSLTKEELLQLGNRLSKSNTTYANMFPLAAALGNKVNEFDEKELVDLVKNTHNTEILRMILTQLYFFKTDGLGNYNNEFKEMLTDSKVEISIRQSILSLLKFDSMNDIEFLSQLATSEEDNISNLSLKLLMSYDSDKASDMALNILENYKNEDVDKVNNALSVFSSKYNRNNYNIREAQQQKMDFKNLCFDLLNNNLFSNNAAYALGNLGDVEAIKEVINSSNVEYLVKVYVIDQNYKVLLNQLNNSPNSETLKLVSNAMQILPIKEFYQPLKDIIASNKIDNETLIKECKNVLQIIADEGVNANTKWDK